MKTTEQSTTLITITTSPLKNIELPARNCYQSEGAITITSAGRMVRKLKDNQHHPMLEFADATFQFITDIGISREIRTHRIASHAQESTRWCNYSAGRFDSQMTFIVPPNMSSIQYGLWHSAVSHAEEAYFKLLDVGAKPQIARSVIPLSLKCSCFMKANLREWMHFIKLRDSFEAHPQIQSLARDVSTILNRHVPQLFESFD